MSSFEQLQPKRFPTSAPVAATSSLLRPLRPLIAVSKPIAPVIQAELERTSRLGYSFATIPLFPPASNDARTQGELLQEKSEPTQSQENITRLSGGLETGIESLSQFPIQAKLIIGPAHNQYEREADQMADWVMRMNAAPTDEHEQALQSAKQPEEEELKLRKEPEIQRASADDGFEAGPDLESRIADSKSGGNPLPDSVRAFMEPRIGADFSGVRIHMGSESAQLNRAVNARAFTRGREIYLSEGQSDLATSEGKRLLAHELTHTIQQGAVPRKIHPRVQQDLTQQARMVPLQGEAPVPYESEKVGVHASQLLERKRQQLTGDIGPNAITVSNIATGLIVQRVKWIWKDGKWRPEEHTNFPAPKGRGEEGDTYDDITHVLTKAPKLEKWRKQKGEFEPIQGKPKNAQDDLEKMLAKKPDLHQKKSGTVVGGRAIKTGTKIDDLNDSSARIDVQNSPGEGLYNVQYQKGTGSVCGILFTDQDHIDTLYLILMQAFEEGGFMVSPSYDKLKEEKKRK